MSFFERQTKILEILEKHGYVTVKYLCKELHYSSATINRDLNKLQSQQVVKRRYGGVELTTSQYVPIFFRAHKMSKEKKLIGSVAAKYVKDGDTIFIDGSTTSQCMESHLLQHKDLTVITNNIALAANLSMHKIEVICLGGTIVEPPSMLGGPESVEVSEKYYVDKMFFSTSALSTDGIISSGIYDMVLKTIASHADEVFYLIDNNKIGQKFQKSYGDLSAVDYVISNYEFNDTIKRRYSKTKFVLVTNEADV